MIKNKRERERERERERKIRLGTAETKRDANEA
jgi:hypothetical protein